MTRVLVFVCAVLLYCMPLFAAMNPLSIASHDQNLLHTDVIFVPSEPDGYRFWMVHTPFPPESVEQIWMVRSNDGETFVGTGITNPIINTSNSGASNYVNQGGWGFDADPDLLYVKELGKWFIAWGAETNQSSPRRFEIAFAYSTDGKSWTLYDGATVNGNTNPVILSGDDNNGQAWEINDTENASWLQYPAMIYEEGTFTIFYGGPMDGANQGPVGCVTFTWNNSTDDIENFARCNSGTPIINNSTDLPATAEYKKGVGHMDVWIENDGSYTMTGQRQFSANGRGEIVYFTSTDARTWTYQGEYLGLGESGSWDDYWVYRLGAVHDGTGRAVNFNSVKTLYYTAYSDSQTTRGGIKDASEFVSEYTPKEEFIGISY
jgi:hypothetical protein